MAKRTWTYEYITAEAEARISSSMKLSASAQAKGNKDSAQRFANFAWGAWHMWNSLTMGWQEPGDSERLEAMTEREIQVLHG